MNILQDLYTLYEQDYVQWCEATVAQLKAGDLTGLDVDHLIEEIERLGKRDRRELKSRLTVLLAHLLKRTYVDSPENFNGWELTIREQRRQIEDLLDDSPSLNAHVREIFERCWERAIADVRLEYSSTLFPDAWAFDGDIKALLSTQYWN